VRAEDQFHVGIVVDDLDGALLSLGSLFGYRWCDEVRVPNPVTTPAGESVVDLRFRYSMDAPRVEVIQAVPGTLWEPAAGSGIHHLGYWSDDLAGDTAALEARGCAMEASGQVWAYHRSPSGPRIELVDRAVQPMLEQYWSTGRMPS
jgi:hypothetical protein